jgi:hypothetical protein
MLDVIFSLSMIVFFLAALAYLRFCESLQKGEAKK